MSLFAGVDNFLLKRSWINFYSDFLSPRMLELATLLIVSLK